MLETRLKRSDMIGCVLCKDAPCSSACEKIDPAKVLRSIWFDNEDGAAAVFPAGNPCLYCSAPCEEKCISRHKVPIKELMFILLDEVKPSIDIRMPQDDAVFCLLLLSWPVPMICVPELLKPDGRVCVSRRSALWIFMKLHRASRRSRA